MTFGFLDSKNLTNDASSSKLPSFYKVLTEERESQKFDKFFVKNDSLIYQIEDDEVYYVEENEPTQTFDESESADNEKALSCE